MHKFKEEIKIVLVKIADEVQVLIFKQPGMDAKEFENHFDLSIKIIKAIQ